MSLLSLFLVLSFFAVVAFSEEYNLQFSHQAPQIRAAVDLRVNGFPVPAFTDVTYGTVSEFVNLTRFANEDAEAGVFNLTLIVSSTGDVLSSELYTFQEAYSSYYVINTLYLYGGFDILFLGDDFSQPEELHGLWRVANFAPVGEDFVLTINDETQTGFAWSSVTDYASVSSGVYNFEVSYANGTVVVSSNATVTSGAVVTLIFNGDGAVLTPFVIETVLDHDYIETYTSCFVRVINSVADADYSALTPVYSPGSEVLFENITFGEMSEYAELEVGDYTIYFAQDGATPAEIAASPSTNLLCEPSQYYTLTYQGVPSSVLTPLEASHYVDQTLKPYYLQAEVRVDFLSTSYDTEFLFVNINGVQVTSVAYDRPTAYLPVSSETVNITLVGLEGQVWTDTFDVTFGQTYSYFVLGLSNSQEYPLSSVLVEDSQTDEPTTTTGTTTTGTTTTGTTGTSGTTGTTGSQDDDDDDDDDLSGGEVAGIVIGVIAGVAILGGLIFFVVRRQRRAQFSTIG